MIRLEKINRDYLDELSTLRQELIAENSTFDGCSWLDQYEDINEWIKYNISLESYETMPKECKLVPAYEYMLIDDEKNRLLGLFNARLELNDFLLNVGGHIGYLIRPSERRKGYAKLGLKLCLDEYARMGYDKVLVTCLTTNEGSRKTIQANGGYFDGEGKQDDHIVNRYWIPLKAVVNDREYHIIKFLGRGKGGYSYLAESEGKLVTFKKIHHEPCEYYSFGNKIEAEREDYVRIKNTGIRIPKMIYIDSEQEVVIKEYIDGPTIMDMINRDENVDSFIPQVKEMAGKCYECGLNIDYYPTNFIVQNGLLYYIDYECNLYSEEWNFENWGEKIWKKQN